MVGIFYFEVMPGSKPRYFLRFLYFILKGGDFYKAHIIEDNELRGIFTPPDEEPAKDYRLSKRPRCLASDLQGCCAC
jgi:hypothetical protein